MSDYNYKPLHFRVGDKVRFCEYVEENLTFYQDVVMTVIGFLDETDIRNSYSKDLIMDEREMSVVDYKFFESHLSSIRPGFLVIVDEYERGRQEEDHKDGKIYDMGYDTIYPLFLELDIETMRNKKLKTLI